MVVDASWQPDPSGRHEYRYWDGAAWTADVSDGGIAQRDEPGWPPPPADAGLGLRSGSLRCIVRGGGPWPVLDGAGAQVGWVAPGPMRIGGRTAEVWDAYRNLWLQVKQSMHGTVITAAGQEVGRIGWHGVGAMSTVNISLELGGRVRARMSAKGREFAEGSARVTDPGGAEMLAVRLGRDRDGKVVDLQRIVAMPDDYEYLVQALTPALLLELSDRAGFESPITDAGLPRFRGAWPGG